MEKEKKCAIITFNKKIHADKEIIAMILDCNETEGYSIKNENTSNGMTCIAFEEIGHDQNERHNAFIKDGKIYCRNMKDWIMDILESNEIRLNTDSVEVPVFIQNYLIEKTCHLKTLS